MKTNVTETSITAYYNHPTKQSQKLRVANYCLKQTKAGKPVWISDIASHFAIAGQLDLAQLSTVSGRLKEIKDEGVILNGDKYRLHLLEKKKPANGRTPVEMYALVLDAGENNQLELF